MLKLRKSVSLSTISIIILIILPFIATILIIYDREIFNATIKLIQYDLEVKEISDIYNYYEIIHNFTILGIFFIMLGIYAPYPILYSSKQYFKKHGYQNVIKEHQQIKKILYISIPIFLFLTIIILFKSNYWLVPFLRLVEQSLDQRAFETDLQLIHIISLFIVFSSFLRIYIQLLKKDFRYYFALACITVAKNEDEEDNWKFLIMGLQSYDLYLRRYLNLQIISLNKIYDKIITSIEKNIIIESLL